MKSDWTYRDLIDLSFFSNLDNEVDQAQLHKRDRSIYLAENLEKQEKGKKELLQQWLRRRRREVSPDTGGASPGSIVHDALSLLTSILLGVGLISGMAAGISFFSYSGTTPVNVFHFLFIFIFSQLALYVFLLVSAMLRLLGTRQLPSVIVLMYGALMSFCTRRIARPIMAKLSAEQRYACEQTLGLIRKNRSSYGPLLFWPLFTLSQLVMVAFNTGLLAATLFRIVTSDIAFGWQSTIQFTSPVIYKGVQIFAYPWSWLIPEHYGYPSLSEIEGSQIVLKEGIYHLATRDLVSWWPFLILCLLVYTLLPRFLLLLLGRLRRHRSLQRFFAKSPESLRIVQRMTTPLLSTQAAPLEPRDSGSRISDEHQENHPFSPMPEYALTLLIPVDIKQLCEPPELIARLRRQGFLIDRHEIIFTDYASDQAVLEKLGNCSWQGNNGLLILFEAWMVPIQDSLLFLKELRSAVGNHTPIYVGLIGRNQDDRILTRPTVQESNIWRQKLAGLGDAFLLVQEVYTTDDT